MRMLRQLRTGRIYNFTDILAKRADMVEYDPELAQKRLEAAKRRLEELESKPPEKPVVNKADMETSKELAEVENKIEKIERQKALPPNAKEQENKTSEQKEEEERQAIINNDPEIKKILTMKDKDEIEAYVLLEYGEDLDKRKDLDKLKARAIELRTDRLFE